jgi:Zn-dependent protease
LFDQAQLYPILSIATVLLFAIVFHECAHGFVADRLGDPTARLEGRLTLNPIPHIDVFGTILLPLMTMFAGMPFGYAKPVPVTTTNLRNPRWDSVWVSLAGPVSNLVLALVAAFVIAVVSRIGAAGTAEFLIPLMWTAVGVNVTLAVFNLIPIPPLDGSWILMGILPLNWAIRYSQIRPYGFMILIALMWTRTLSLIISWPRSILFDVFQSIASL